MPNSRSFSNSSCHSEPLAYCHSEGAKRPKNLAQARLREEPFAIAQGDISEKADHVKFLEQAISYTSLRAY